MARVVCVGVNPQCNRVIVESQQFSDLCVAIEYADRLRASMPELSGLVDWTITITSSGRIVERWSMDDVQSEYPHRILTEEFVDVRVHKAMLLLDTESD